MMKLWRIDTMRPQWKGWETEVFPRFLIIRYRSNGSVVSPQVSSWWAKGFFFTNAFRLKEKRRSRVQYRTRAASDSSFYCDGRLYQDPFRLTRRKWVLTLKFRSFQMLGAKFLSRQRNQVFANVIFNNNMLYFWMTASGWIVIFRTSITLKELFHNNRNIFINVWLIVSDWVGWTAKRNACP